MWWELIIQNISEHFDVSQNLICLVMTVFTSVLTPSILFSKVIILHLQIPTFVFMV